MSEAQAPIIIKKVVKGGGHHGGAWKVAYADFVTAMMALFIVLWLLNSSVKVQKAVGGYFRDPEGYGKQVGSGQAGIGEDLAVSKDDMSKLKDKLDAAVKENPKMQAFKDQVQITVTGEGLRVELLETEKGMFFNSGSPSPSEQGREVLSKLAEELGKLPNSILIEGHTDARMFASTGSYSNWELSADRANAARRFMQTEGLRDAQVVQVRGFADQRLWKPKQPDDASNRRVSIIVQYQQPRPDPEAEAKEESKEKAGRAHEGGGEHKAGAEQKPGGEHKAEGEKKPEAEHKPAPVPSHH